MVGSQRSLSTTPSATLTDSGGPDALVVQLQRRSVRGQRWRHGDRIRSGQHHAHRHPHGRHWVPDWLALDSSGDLFVANQNGNVDEFAPGSTTPTATLTGLNDPLALAFDSSGNLFVANANGNTVSEFAPSAPRPRPPSPGSMPPLPWRSIPAAISSWPM